MGAEGQVRAEGMACLLGKEKGRSGQVAMKEELPIMEEPDRDSCDMLCRYLAGGPCYVPRLSNHGPCGPGLPFSP